MHPDLTHLQRLEELDVLLEESNDRPLLLFKHSLSCGTSYEALDELIDHLNEVRLKPDTTGVEIGCRHATR